VSAVQIPNVVRTDYNLLDITEDGFVSLMMDNGETREDLMLPNQTEEDNKLADQIQKDFEDGKELTLSVLKAMEDEKIIASKAAAAS
jgi:translation initiation factor 5A